MGIHINISGRIPITLSPSGPMIRVMRLWHNQSPTTLFIASDLESVLGWLAMRLIWDDGRLWIEDSSRLATSDIHESL